MTGFGGGVKVLNIVHNVLNIRQNRRQNGVRVEFHHSNAPGVGMMKFDSDPILVVRAVHTVHELRKAGRESMDLAIAQVSGGSKQAGGSGFRGSS